MTTFAFATKAEYLAWKAEWKRQYAQTTSDSRAAKAARKVGTQVERSRAQHIAHVLRWQARTALEARKDAKALSWQMKQESMAKK